MKSMIVKFALLVLIVGLLAACASQPTEAPASEPTETAAPATEAPTDIPTEASTVTEPPAASSPTAEAAAGGTTVSFATDILPMLQSRCSNCHGGQRTEEGLSLRSHAGVMTGSEEGAVVIAGDAANSLLVQMVAEGKMPKRGPKLTPDQVQLLTDWINQGALNN